MVEWAATSVFVKGLKNNIPGNEFRVWSRSAIITQFYSHETLSQSCTCKIAVLRDNFGHEICAERTLKFGDFMREFLY